MSLLKSLKLFFCAVAIAGVIASPAIAQSNNSAPYLSLNPSFPSDTPNQIEVLEFFSYACGHCGAIEPAVEKLKTELPSSVTFSSVPVAYNAAMQPMQKLYYTLAALNRLDLHPSVFHAIQVERKPLFTRKDIVAWAVEKGLNQQEFEQAYDSFGVNTKIRIATELTEKYNVTATPSFAVAGKYLTSPGMTGSYDATISMVKALVKKETK